MKSIVTILIVIIVILLAINSFLRVANGSESHGCIEELLFKKSFKKVIDNIFFSGSLNLYNEINESAFFVADLIAEYGYRIVKDEELEDLRTKAINSLEIALYKCTKIQDSYLEESNKELPLKYRKHFQKALIHWKNGLENKDTEEVLIGNSEYNTFLIWIKTHERSDFKNMR